MDDIDLFMNQLQDDINAKEQIKGHLLEVPEFKLLSTNYTRPF